MLGIAAVYLGDAGGLWQTPPGALAPMLVLGFLLAGVTSRIGYRVRRRRASRASAENTDDPASTRGSQAMR
ncbi:hypothetical protein OHS16_11805 [Streptomyces sp. NBC_00344]